MRLPMHTLMHVQDLTTRTKFCQTFLIYALLKISVCMDLFYRQVDPSLKCLFFLDFLARGQTLAFSTTYLFQEFPLNRRSHCNYSLEFFRLFNEYIFCLLCLPARERKMVARNCGFSRKHNKQYEIRKKDPLSLQIECYSCPWVMSGIAVQPQSLWVGGGHGQSLPSEVLI